MNGRARRTAVAVTATALAAAVLVAPTTARADDTCTIGWRGGVGAWSDPARWSPARLPTADDAVCIVRAPGADPVSVRLTAATSTDALTLTGAAFVVPTGISFDVEQVLARRATLTGGGTVRGAVGFLDLADTQLRGVHLSTTGGLRLAGRITFTGGSTVDATGFTDPEPGLRVIDADGNGANHITVSNFPLYLFGPVFVGVGLALRDASLFVQRDGVVLTKLDNLDSAGRLQAPPRSTLLVGVTDGATLTLQRSITSIAGDTTVFASGNIRTPDGSDALSALTTLDGTLALGGDQFVAGGSITVRGRLTSGAPLVAPDIRIRPGAYFDADRVTGALTCGGQCLLAGAHLGRLTLLPTAKVGTDVTAPITVDGRAALDGTMTVSLPSTRPRPGTTVVLLTAGRGVTGTFDAVTTDRPGRSVTPGYQPAFVTGTIGTAA